MKSLQGTVKALEHLRMRQRRRLFSATSTAATTPPPTIVVALSGGVDSSVAAALLKETYGSSVTGIHMSNWNSVSHDDDSLTACSSEQDWKDAAKTAQHLDLPVTRHHFEREYWNDVFEPYLNNLMENAQMGNPDMACNRHVKFGALREYCLQQYGADMRLATGHYARLWQREETDSTSTAATLLPESIQKALEEDTALADWLLDWGLRSNSNHRPPPPILLAAADKSKDQSYFLAACTADSLHNVLFPLGDLYKKERNSTSTATAEQLTVRQMAADMQLPTANKRESMGICFVGKRPSGFRDFLTDYLPAPANKIQFVDVDTGTVVAESAQPEHAALYTIGQGAKLSGTPQKYFVVDTEPADDTVWVCAGTHHAALYADSLQASVQWMARNEPPLPLVDSGEMRVQCRIRHLQPLMDCTLVKGEDDVVTVIFDKPVRGVALGQTAVFYVGGGLVCLGGGPIVSRGSTYHERGLVLPLAKNLSLSGSNDLSLQQQASS